jgi:hypothetical protein
MQRDLVNFWSFNTISIANLETSNNFQQRVMPSCIHQLIIKLTPNTDSEGVLAQENILNLTGAILTSEGAHTACRLIVKLDAAAKSVQAERLPMLVSVFTPHFEGARAPSGRQEYSVINIAFQ